jgi:hypothetical protein
VIKLAMSEGEIPTEPALGDRNVAIFFSIVNSLETDYFCGYSS